MRSQRVSERRSRGAELFVVVDSMCGYWIMVGLECQY
jgi:hypothetical protein